MLFIARSRRQLNKACKVKLITSKDALQDFFFHTKFFFRYITNILNSEFFSLKLKLTWPRILSRFSHFG